MLPTETAHGPFRPGDGQTEKKESEEVRNKEGGSIIFGSEPREAEEVAKADGATRDRKNDSKGGAPAIFFS